MAQRSLVPIAPLVQERARTFAEIYSMVDFLYLPEINIDQAEWDKLRRANQPSSPSWKVPRPATPSATGTRRPSGKPPSRQEPTAGVATSAKLRRLSGWQ